MKIRSLQQFWFAIFMSLSILNRNPYADPYVWSGQSNVAIFLSILCCKILVQQVLQLRLDRRIAMEDWQKYSKGGLPRRLPGNWQASIGVLSSILHCNDSVDPQLQHLFDQSLATEDWQKYCNVALATSDRFAYLSTLLLYSKCCTLHLQPANQYRQHFAESLTPRDSGVWPDAVRMCGIVGWLLEMEIMLGIWNRIRIGNGIKMRNEIRIRKIIGDKESSWPSQWLTSLWIAWSGK